MKRLWQTLLPGTPLPSCGVTDESAAKADERDDQAGAGIVDRSQIGHSKTRS
jgi:hypothetical protein